MRHAQVLYLDAQTWGQSRWKSIMAALSSTLQRAPSLLDGYIALARSTGPASAVRLCWPLSMAGGV
jgi:hypothetical protein